VNSPGGRLGIVADDLTGGAAIGAEAARLGNPVDVVRIGQPVPPKRSVVIETGSRYIQSQLAAERVVEAARLLLRSGVSVLMKKIDSTLKGNVAAELSAFADSCPGRLLVAPSCPEMGLTVRDGRQHTPRGPGVSVLDLLSTSINGPLAALNLNTVREGSAAVANWLRQNPHGTVLADAETDADLAAIALGAAEAKIVSFAGTYGLGAALAGTFLPSGTAPRFTPPALDGMIVVAGSASATTASQISHLVAAGAEEIVLDMERILTGGAEEEARRAASQILSSAAKLLVVHTAAERTGKDVADHCRRLGWNERDLANLLAIPFASALHAAPGYAAYFIGGETTGAVFEKLGLDSLVIHGECSAAVPFAVSTAPSGWPLILTKPGAFGSENTLTETAGTLLRHDSGATPVGAADNRHPSIR
jgi:D-threonate/D-erythronate kinase